jgi:hypothetical protein
MAAIPIYPYQLTPPVAICQTSAITAVPPLYSTNTTSLPKGETLLDGQNAQSLTIPPSIKPQSLPGVEVVEVVNLKNTKVRLSEKELLTFISGK